ncbi:hypothetical protein J3A83DRAFT_4213111 [Scleroderma citrinum]
MTTKYSDMIFLFLLSSSLRLTLQLQPPFSHVKMNASGRNPGLRESNHPEQCLGFWDHNIGMTACCSKTLTNLIIIHLCSTTLQPPELEKGPYSDSAMTI